VLALLREDPAVTMVERDLPVELSLRGSVVSMMVTGTRLLSG